MVIVTIKDTPIKFEIDIGTMVTIMNEKFFPHKVLKYTVLKLQTFCKTVIDIIKM